MSPTSSDSALHEPFPPIPALASISLQDDVQATPTPRMKKARSESPPSTMTPPDSARGAPLAVNESEKQLIGTEAAVFVRTRDDDDVFGRSSSATSQQTTKMQSTSEVAIAKVQASLPESKSFRQTPRSDRMNSPITPANAQGVLPPEACVFVANLATARTDDQLELACHNHFDVFGECHIKVRRDKHRHPFALVQYYNVDDANNAIQSSRDIVIDGRTIRTEHAQARRSVVLIKIGGGAIPAEDAQQALGGFGPIAQMYPTTNSDARDLGLPEGMWVQFAYYLDYKDAIKSFNNTTTEYRIHVPPEAETGTHIAASCSPIVRGLKTPRSAADQKSIFVGNLPSDTTEHHLKQLFSDCGIIRAVNIIHKPIQGGSGYNVFGFIEFSTGSEAEIAAGMEVEVNGTKIRVEPKEYSARRHTRLQQYSPSSSPYWRGQRQVFSNSLFNNNQGIPLSYSPGFYGLQSPSQLNGSLGYSTIPNVASGMHDLSPFHHRPDSFANLYATPPPSTRVPRRSNEMLYTGSPHASIQQWSPFIPTVHGHSFAAGNGMMQIPEELEGQLY